MASDSIQYDLSEVQDLLEKAQATFLEGTAAYTQILEQAGRKVGVRAESLVGEYPPAPRRPLNAYYTRVNAAGEAYQSKFKTLKQQGYYFASLADGNITLPHKRSGWLGASITSDVTVESTGVLVEVGTPVGYAPLVIGNESEQSFFHAETGWQSLGEQLDEGSDVLLEAFIEGVAEGVEAYLAG